MSSKWYMSSCFNTGLQASRIANDAILSMTISTALFESKSVLLNDNNTQIERFTRAISLLDDIITRMNKPQLQRLQVQTTADPATNLVYVLIAKSAGDIKTLISKLETSRSELNMGIKGRYVFSSDTFMTLRMIEAAAREVVEDNNSSLIDIE